MSHLNKQVQADIATVASDKHVQCTCIDAMFNGCERGTDLWESLEQDSKDFSPETRILLWGSEDPFRDIDDEDEEIKEEILRDNSLSGKGATHLIIECLLNEVQSNLFGILR